MMATLGRDMHTDINGKQNKINKVAIARYSSVLRGGAKQKLKIIIAIAI